MYLAAWSPRGSVSPAMRAALFTTVPEADRERLLLTDHEGATTAGRSARRATRRSAVSKWSDADAERTRDKDGGTDEQRAAVAQFIASVPRVARVLRNTSTMMIFDHQRDHRRLVPVRAVAQPRPGGAARARLLLRYGPDGLHGVPGHRQRPDPVARSHHGPHRPPGGLPTRWARWSGTPVRPTGHRRRSPRTAVPRHRRGRVGLIAGPSAIASIRTLIADGAAPVVAHTDELDRLLGLDGNGHPQGVLPLHPLECVIASWSWHPDMHARTAPPRGTHPRSCWAIR